MPQMTNEQKANLILDQVIKGLCETGVDIKGHHMPLLYQFKALIVRVSNDVDRAKLTKRQGDALMTAATEKVVELILTETENTAVAA